MATPVLMPKQGNTVEECILVSWKKKKGDTVKTGEIVADIETDKATFEIEAPADGEILETFFTEGTLVPVLTNIAVIGKSGEDVSSFKPVKTVKAPVESKAASPVAATPSAATSAPSKKQAAASASAPVSVSIESGVSPRARRLAQAKGVDPYALGGSGPGGRVIERDVRSLASNQGRVSSLARELIHGKKMRSPASGSGPGGMVLSSDLLEPGKPLSNMRKVVASRMRESLSETAQFTASAYANALPMMKLRAIYKKQNQAITFNDMVMFAAVKALALHPEVNAEFIGGEVFIHKDVHLGFACDTPRGLMVPVVKNADKMSIAELAARIKELAGQAVEGKISPDDLSGGTFTVSNLGSFGVTTFTPIINYPQVAILGVGSIELRPLRRDGQVVFEEHMIFSLTSDHQIVDGAPAARFLQTVIKKVEGIESLVGE